MDKAKMQFTLSGFSEQSGFRVFAFEGVGSDRSRTAFTVKVDMALARKLGIPLQELPLLCRSVLSRLEDPGDDREFTFTEEAMESYARECEASRRKVAHKKARFAAPSQQTQTEKPEVAAPAAANPRPAVRWPYALPPARP